MKINIVVSNGVFSAGDSLLHFGPTLSKGIQVFPNEANIGLEVVNLVCQLFDRWQMVCMTATRSSEPEVCRLGSSMCVVMTLGSRFPAKGGSLIQDSLEEADSSAP